MCFCLHLPLFNALRNAPDSCYTYIPCWCQHQAEDAVRILGEFLQDGEDKCGSLATPRLGTAHAVTTCRHKKRCLFIGHIRLEATPCKQHVKDTKANRAVKTIPERGIKQPDLLGKQGWARSGPRGASPWRAAGIHASCTGVGLVKPSRSACSVSHGARPRARKAAMARSEKELVASHRRRTKRSSNAPLEEEEARTFRVIRATPSLRPVAGSRRAARPLSQSEARYVSCASHTNVLFGDWPVGVVSFPRMLCRVGRV